MRFEELIGVSTWDGVRNYLNSMYVRNSVERKRRRDALERDELYENRGEEYMERLVNKAYKNDKNRELRRALIPVTKWNNVISRVVNEKATVYSEPARRRVANDNVYQRFLELVSLDEVMRELNRMLVLHEDVWVQYRVRDVGGGKRLPAVDVTSPSLFWALAPPRDQTLHIGTLLDQVPCHDRPNPTEHHYRLWTHFETISLDAELRILKREDWPLKRMPGFIASSRPATGKKRLLALSPCADLVSAHKGVWFQDILLFKESKSANKQLYATGDTSAAAMGQQADTENDAFLPEGVTVQAIDRGMDLEQFRSNSDHIMERAGANHGLPPSVIHHRDSSSGAEVYLRRTPLRELRAQQIPVMRRVERELAEIQSIVNKVDLTEFAFEIEEWGVDFGEVQQPLTEQERDQVFETRRSNGMTSTVEEERARNPDLKTDAEAKARIKKRQRDETERLKDGQEMQRLNGSASSQVGDKTPEQNGANGRTAATAPKDLKSIARRVLRAA